MSIKGVFAKTIDNEKIKGILKLDVIDTIACYAYLSPVYN